MEKCFVYILYSSMWNRFYIGSAVDPEVRLTQHNAGKVIATRNGVPWELVYREECIDQLSARRREREIKNWKSADRIRKLIDR